MLPLPLALLVLFVGLGVLFRVWVSNPSKRSSAEERLIQQKQRQKQDFLEKRKRVTGDVPNAPGQRYVSKWIRLDLGFPLPKDYSFFSDRDSYKLSISGSVFQPVCLSWTQICQLGPSRIYDQQTWHCVTGWSAKNLTFTGIPIKYLLDRVQPQEQWKCVLQISADGYTTVVPREEVEREDVFIAIGDAEGRILSQEHGGWRLVFPQLYGWKSAKYLVELRFVDYQETGYWEKLGCHYRGRVGEEERFQEQAQGIWKVLVAMTDAYRIVGGSWIWIQAMQIGGRLLGYFSHDFALTIRNSKEKKQ